ncbi:MAG: alcohol dehydrogenase catalytic domain-containing protein [Alicyclobacillaceae bacterium]|nr:alcohol dehydrogenase catalytic domain-containing protein [Alicyclobacillaceae bacterium]
MRVEGTFSAWVFQRHQGLKEVRLERRTLLAHEVRLSVDACGVCGSDRAVVQSRGQDAPVGMADPVVMGHEISGTVMEVGGEVSQVRVGEGVVVYPFISCSACRACRAGQPNLCMRQHIVGYHRDGGYAEEVVVPAEVLLARPSNRSAAASALLVDAYATPLHALKSVADVQAEESVLVMGGGGLGLAAIQLVPLVANGPVALWTRRESMREMGARFGAAAVFIGHAENVRNTAREVRRWSGGGVDVVLDTEGSESSLYAALQVVRPGGRVCVVGMSPARAVLPLSQMVRLGITVVGSYASTVEECALLLEWSSAGLLDSGLLVGRSVPMGRLAEALTGNSHAVGRMVFQPGGE